MHVNLGFSLALLGKTDEAKKVFSQVLRKGEVLNNLGLAHELLGKEKEAQRLYEEALDADPKLNVARDNRSSLETEKVEKMSRPKQVGGGG